MSHVFDGYAPAQGRDPRPPQRRAVSQDDGDGRGLLRCGTCRSAAGCSSARANRVYEGMIVGIHSRDNDLVVNPIKEQEAHQRPRRGQGRRTSCSRRRSKLTLEYAVEFIDDDELVEVTPKTIRIRKRYLNEHERKRAAREQLPA